MMEELYSLNFNDLMAESDDLGHKIYEETGKHGYLLIRGANFEVTEGDTHKKEFLDFCKLLGTPILHNSMPDSYVWDIKPVKNTKSTFITHSELALEAELHTDSAFSDNPEDYFCLYSIKKADCNGGESLLLSKEYLLRELRKTEEGIEAEKQFRTKKFPFAVPSIFKEGHKSQNENLYAKDYILSGDTIRYRSDVIEKSLNIEPQLIDSDQRKALQVLQNILESSTAVKRFMLEVGDLIIINNKTMLHGRTAFKDNDRHLLRVRIRCNENFAKASD
jgi:alpha-ketoglutarate-dependent taurine dioxygenase